VYIILFTFKILCSCTKSVRPANTIELHMSGLDMWVLFKTLVVAGRNKPFIKMSESA